jgi:hypothetical protein
MKNKWLLGPVVSLIDTPAHSVTLKRLPVEQGHAKGSLKLTTFCKALQRSEERELCLKELLVLLGVTREELLELAETIDELVISA